MSFLGAIPTPQPTRPPTQITYTGDPAHESAVRQAAQQFEYPGDTWHVTVLTPQQYQEWQRHLPPEHQGINDGAFSLLGTDRTYLSQDWIQKHPNDIAAKLAHEMGHITQNSHDENVANKWAAGWLADQRRAEALRQFKGNK